MHLSRFSGWDEEAEEADTPIIRLKAVERVDDDGAVEGSRVSGSSSLRTSGVPWREDILTVLRI